MRGGHFVDHDRRVVRSFWRKARARSASGIHFDGVAAGGDGGDGSGRRTAALWRRASARSSIVAARSSSACLAPLSGCHSDRRVGAFTMLAPRFLWLELTSLPGTGS